MVAFLFFFLSDDEVVEDLDLDLEELLVDFLSDFLSPELLVFLLEDEDFFFDLLLVLDELGGLVLEDLDVGFLFSSFSFSTSDSDLCGEDEGLALCFSLTGEF